MNKISIVAFAGSSNSAQALSEKNTYMFSGFGASALHQIAHNESRSATYPWSLSDFTSSLDQGHFCFGLKDGSHWVAHAVISTVLDQAELLIVTVLPEYRKQGLASAFLSYIIGRLREQGVAVFMLEVRESNLGAISLYKKLGFQEVGKRKGYYPVKHEDGSVAGREDALLFSCDLL